MAASSLTLKQASCYVIIMFYVTCAGAADLLPYGEEAGDSELVYSSDAIASEKISLFFPTQLLGPGLISEIFVSSVGTLSYAKLETTELESLRNNLVVTPFMADMGSGGRVFYRQTDNDIETISQVSALLQARVSNFSPLLVVVVTWADMPSPDDPTKTNTFQSILTTDGDQTFVVMNYKDSIAWTSSGARRSYAGVFVAGDALDRCGAPMKNSGTDQIWTVAESSSGGSSARGRHVIELTGALECQSFESPCGEPPQLGRTRRTPFFENGNDNVLGWSFFVELECKSGLEIAPGVSTQRVQCLYEPDYYEYAWDYDIKECVDLKATRKMKVLFSNVLVNLIGQQSIEVVKQKLLPEINKLLSKIGITDVVIKIDSVKRSISFESTFRDGTTNEDQEDDFSAPLMDDSGSSAWDIEFTIFSPTYANKDLTPALLQSQLLAVLSTATDLSFSGGEIVVEDETDKCLQQCICFIREKGGKNCKRGTLPGKLRPDACCGGCDGKPYASSKKVCCGGQHLYDPSRAVCCNGRVRQGSACPLR